MSRMTWTMTVTVPPSMWLTSNGRYHWARKAKSTKLLRQLAAVNARAMGLPRGLNRAHVTVLVHGRTNNRMDPANTYPTVKACIDGIVTDFGLLPDDDDRHLIGPDMRRGEPRPDLPKGHHQLTITIEEETS